jgi:uncharacterized protein (DUF1810 family)
MDDETQSLDRFVAAQQQVFPRALAEIRAGDKQSHWMWFIFPQVAGLGHSAMAQRYAISDIGEAWRYLAHPLLGPRLVECTGAMLGWSGKRSAQAILGPLDAMKFRSSMTLFQAAGGNEHFGLALDRFFSGEPDGETLSLLATIAA